VQHFLVCGNMGEQPFVTDVVKTSANVALQHPRRTVLAGQHEEALPDGVSRASARTKAVGVFVRVVSATGDNASRCNACMARSRIVGIPSGLNLPLAFGMWTRRSGCGLITASSQCADGFVLRRRGAPDCSVHPRRMFALIVRHPFHGQGFAGKRAGQEPLQGFTLPQRFS